MCARVSTCTFVIDVGILCVCVYLSEQLFQRERISASVIASAIFSP